MGGKAGTLNKTLLRKQFIDQTIGPEELQGIALLLSDWRRQSGGGTPSFRITLQLWGFPHAVGSERRDFLQDQARQNGLAGDVTLTDDDILVLESGPLPDPTETSSTNVGGYLRLLIAPILENLWCEIRLTMGGGSEERILSLNGIVRDQTFLLKAVWPLGGGYFTEATLRFTPWPGEAKFLDAVRAYWDGQRKLPDWARSELYGDAARRTVGNALVWFLTPTTVGLAPILLRVAGTLGIIITAAVGLALTRQSAPGLIDIWAVFLIIALAGLTFTVLTKGLAIVSVRRSMYANSNRLATVEYMHPEVDLAAQPGALLDPALLKYSTDLLALGATHFKDVSVEPPINGASYNRIFLLPDEDTLFIVGLIHRVNDQTVFPATPIFAVQTGFRNGLRLLSANSGTGWRKPVLDSVTTRLMVGVTDPAVMLERHRAQVLKIENGGNRRAPLNPAAIIDDMVTDNREMGVALAKYGYFHWSDAFRMVFKMPRREYEG